MNSAMKVSVILIKGLLANATAGWAELESFATRVSTQKFLASTYFEG